MSGMLQLRGISPEERKKMRKESAPLIEKQTDMQKFIGSFAEEYMNGGYRNFIKPEFIKSEWDNITNYDKTKIQQLEAVMNMGKKEQQNEETIRKQIEFCIKIACTKRGILSNLKMGKRVLDAYFFDWPCHQRWCNCGTKGP